MSATGNLKSYLREYGYENLPGIEVIAKRCRFKNVDFYTELAGKERPALFVREKDGEWLTVMKLSDFMELYREWEMKTADVRDLPFYGTGKGDSEDGI